VAALLTACRAGPPMGWVDSIVEEFAEPPAEPGFRRVPSA
jgi:acylphosphatase